MNAFLASGARSCSSIGGTDGDAVSAPTEPSGDSSALSECKMIRDHQPKANVQIDAILKDALSANEQCDGVRTQPAPAAAESEASATRKADATGPDPSKPKRLKAKLLRAQRKTEKEQKKLAQNVDSASMEVAPPPPKAGKNVEHTLESLIEGQPSDGKHQLKV